MSKISASPPVDESISTRKHPYRAPPAVPKNKSTCPAARARSVFVGAFYGYALDTARSAYTPLITQSLSYLFCKFGGGSQCSGLSLCVTNFFLMLRYAAMSYVESRDDTKPQTRSVDFVGLSLMFCSFFYYCVTYYNATCVPRL
ncbi:hypothetical protein J3E69DRAFT_346364 [Trichoderma sp. SZMC 28015]